MPQELSYKDIYFENKNWTHLKRLLKTSTFSKVFIIVDSNTIQHCFPIFFANFPELYQAEIIEIEPGEVSKDIDIAYGIIETLIENQADRDSLIINLGGGVVCDLGGFVASIYKRGIQYINIPTTLLAFVDASFGGKTGVNYKNFKNQIGTFHKPAATYIFHNFLNTLERNEILSGIAEMIKHALLSEPSVFSRFLKKFKPDFIPDISLIKESIATKYHIVDKDLFDCSIRKSLNFGHTVGHAIESWSYLKMKNKITHGQAIALGMLAELELSFRKLNFPLEIKEKVCMIIIQTFTIPNVNSKDINLWIKIMKQDKKNCNNNICFSLLKNIGNCVTNVTCDEKEIKNILEYIFMKKNGL